jgi:hypothetical protein
VVLVKVAPDFAPGRGAELRLAKSDVGVRIP